MLNAIKTLLHNSKHKIRKHINEYRHEEHQTPPLT